MTAQIIEFNSKRLELASKKEAMGESYFQSNFSENYAGNLAINREGFESGSFDDNLSSRAVEAGVGRKLNMKCLACDELDESLQDFIDGEIDEMSRHRLSQHLQVCEKFKRRLEHYQFLKLAAGSLDSKEPLDNGIRSRLRERLNSELDLKIKY